MASSTSSRGRHVTDSKLDIKGASPWGFLSADETSFVSLYRIGYVKVGVSPFCDIFYIAKLTHFSLDLGFYIA